MRAIIGRVAAAIVAAALTWVAGVAGIEVTQETAATLTEAVTLLGMGLFTIMYAVGHRLIDRRINPADAASPAAIQAGQDAQSAHAASARRL